jgi:epoxyqueuosine reductase
MEATELSRLIKDQALELGFDVCGIAQVHTLIDQKPLFERWISQGFHGEMSYLARNVEMRHDPALILPKAQSVISVLLNYFPSDSFHPKAHYKIAKYAYGKDYHDVIKAKLNTLMQFIKEFSPDSNMRSFTDSAPINDRYWAQQAGLGWIGKNSLLLNKSLGSYFFIGEIVTDLKLYPDSNFESNYCGNCTQCLDACPTGALQQPYVMDARRCISYLSIESKNEIPEELSPKLNQWIYGCDICQEVCPWNRKNKPHSVPEFKLSDALMKMQKEDFENLTQAEFDQLFKGNPLNRSGFPRLKYLISKNQNSEI